MIEHLEMLPYLYGALLSGTASAGLWVRMGHSDRGRVALEVEESVEMLRSKVANLVLLAKLSREIGPAPETSPESERPRHFSR